LKKLSFRAVKIKNINKNDKRSDVYKDAGAFTNRLQEFAFPSFVTVKLPAKHAKRHEKKELRIPIELKDYFQWGQGGLPPWMYENGIVHCLTGRIFYL
jgi:hypothetical protein